MSDLGLTVHTFFSVFWGLAKLIKLRMYTLLWIVIKSCASKCKDQFLLDQIRDSAELNFRDLF